MVVAAVADMAEGFYTLQPFLILVLLLSTDVFTWPSTQSSPYPAVKGKCRDEQKEYYKSEIKKCCQRCPPGQYASSKCNNTLDTVCQECQEGTYTEVYNYSPKCFTCMICDPVPGFEEATPCSKERNTQCVCRQGTYCITVTGRCTDCHDHSHCDPGTEVDVAGTNMMDTTCKPCKPGFYNNVSSADAKCLPHTQCKDMAVPGTPQSDAVCKNETSTSFSTSSLATNPTDSPSQTTPAPGGHHNTILIAVTVIALCVLIISLLVWVCWRKCPIPEFFSYGKRAFGKTHGNKDKNDDKQSTGTSEYLLPPSSDTSPSCELTQLGLTLEKTTSSSNGDINQEIPCKTADPTHGVSNFLNPRQQPPQEHKGQIGSPGSFNVNGQTVTINGDIYIINGPQDLTSRSPDKSCSQPVTIVDDNVSQPVPEDWARTPVQEQHGHPDKDTCVCEPHQEYGKEDHLAIQEIQVL